MTGVPELSMLQDPHRNKKMPHNSEGGKTLTLFCILHYYPYSIISLNSSSVQLLVFFLSRGQQSHGTIHSKQALGELHNVDLGWSCLHVTKIIVVSDGNHTLQRGG